MIRYAQTPLYHAVELAFVTDDDAKMLKNATHFAYNGLPWGDTAPQFTSLESPRQADVKL